MAVKKGLDWLVKINDYLEKFPETILTYFYALEAFGENLTQEYVDVWCRYLAWQVNINIERVRQRVLRSLNDQNSIISKVIGIINTAQQIIKDPMGAIGSFFSSITSPITSCYYFITTLVTELARLAANLAHIAEVLPPAPPNPRINFNEFKIQIGTVGMTSLAGVESLPPPEVMFPEPAQKPFSKESFEVSFDSGKGAFEETRGEKRFFYTPKEQEES